jgi:hypothetical protein
MYFDPPTLSPTKVKSGITPKTMSLTKCNVNTITYFLSKKLSSNNSTALLEKESFTSSIGQTSPKKNQSLSNNKINKPQEIIKSQMKSMLDPHAKICNKFNHRDKVADVHTNKKILKDEKNFVGEWRGFKLNYTV